MNIKIQSQEKYLRDHIISETIEKVTDEYSIILNYSIDELTKLNMRKIAESEDYNWRSADILSKSIAVTKSTLEKDVKTYNLGTDFSNYFKETRKNLKPVANELSNLQNKLFSSRQEERIGTKEEIISTDEQFTFDIVEIGLKGSVEGVISVPVLDSFDLDIDRAKNNYDITGDWFPFEIKIDYYTFILDDDGTIFVSTENLPDEFIKKSKRLLENLANKIYADLKLSM